MQAAIAGRLHRVKNNSFICESFNLLGYTILYTIEGPSLSDLKSIFAD